MREGDFEEHLGQIQPGEKIVGLAALTGVVRCAREATCLNMGEGRDMTAIWLARASITNDIPKSIQLVSLYFHFGEGTNQAKPPSHVTREGARAFLTRMKVKLHRVKSKELRVLHLRYLTSQLRFIAASHHTLPRRQPLSHTCGHLFSALFSSLLWYRESLF